MKRFKVTTKTTALVAAIGRASEYVDWYDAKTEAKAREMWAEDCHRYGLPMDKTTAEFVEVAMD